MCGIAGMTGAGFERRRLETLVEVQHHRGPDDRGIAPADDPRAALGANRLMILDLSAGGHQPMASAGGDRWIAFNGEVYNYLELRRELASYPFRSATDTEVVLAAYDRWGPACLDRLVGMFAFAVWDRRRGELFCARDRFGVKPFFFHRPPAGGLWLASEIKALHAAGVPREPDPVAWATYLATGMYDHDQRTFWRGVERLLPGHTLTWNAERDAVIRRCWYDPAQAALEAGRDRRPVAEVTEELQTLLEDSVKLRFRSDVPVGLCLSGGLDSSLLLALVRKRYGADAALKTFTFLCGDERYDETPWVEAMLAGTRHQPCFCPLAAAEVPVLAARVLAFQDEPFGGLPTLGMAKVFAHARREGVTVLLDGNGMDEAWAGYDYYARAAALDAARGPVQGSRSPSVRPDCLTPEFAALAHRLDPATPFGEPLADLQYRDLRWAKIPRSTRFADRVSMMHSRELREPFLDHRIVELGLRQPPEHKISQGVGKRLPRRVAARLLPMAVSEAPKRPLQTPQREWLRGPLATWAETRIEAGLAGWGGGWLDAGAVRQAWREYRDGAGDNSFPVWQWISLGMMREIERPAAATVGER